MIVCIIYLQMCVREQHRHVQHLIYIITTNYDVISENVGIYGPMLYIFKVLTVKNAKKLKLGFSINQIPYITDFEYLPIIVCYERDKYW